MSSLGGPVDELGLLAWASVAQELDLPELDAVGHQDEGAALVGVARLQPAVADPMARLEGLVADAEDQGRRNKVPVGVLQADGEAPRNVVRPLVDEACVDVVRRRRSVLGVDTEPLRTQLRLRPPPDRDNGEADLRPDAGVAFASVRVADENLGAERMYFAPLRPVNCATPTITRPRAARPASTTSRGDTAYSVDWTFQPTGSSCTA